MGIFDAYIRWRHTRGFGVHSPLAFRLVEDVLTSKYEYYAYPEIEDATDTAAPHPGLTRRRALMLHRLAGRLPHCREAYLGDVPEQMRLAVRLAGRSGEGRLTVAVAPSLEDFRTISRRVNSDEEVIALFDAAPEQIILLAAAVYPGVRLIAKNSAIIVVDKRVSQATYAVNL